MQRKLAVAVDPQLVEGFASGSISTCPARGQRDAAVRRYGGRFTRSRYQRSPDREKSILRRRQLAATWPMPPAMAAKLTTSQLAYARIVADEIAVNGTCDRTLDEIAARGGMCRKTAKRAQALLRDLKWIEIEWRPVDGKKHLPNVVTIVSVEWMAWIRLGPKPSPSRMPHRGTLMSHHGKHVLSKSMQHGSNGSVDALARLQSGLSRVGIASSGPPDERRLA
jgi:hypothetical protein